MNSESMALNRIDGSQTHGSLGLLRPLSYAGVIYSSAHFIKYLRNLICRTTTLILVSACLAPKNVRLRSSIPAQKPLLLLRSEYNEICEAIHAFLAR
jgi:hypothetical protein